MKEHSAIFFVSVLSFLIIFLNLFNGNTAKALENQVPHTVMATLIKRDFSHIADEEIVEKGIDLDSILITGKDKYIENPSSLEKNHGLIAPLATENTDQIALTKNQDVVLKPKSISMNIANGETRSLQRKKVIQYTVKSGDTVSTIARKFGISANTVLWANNLSSFSLIRPGDSLTILPYSGILYTVKRGNTLAQIAKTYNISEAKIRESNNIGPILKIGEKLMLPGGKKTSYTKRSTRNYTGVSVIKDFVKSSAKPVSGNKMLWPTIGHRITQYFSWRHPGLDIANKMGTPLYASDSGKVVHSGWSRGYGYNVVIDHGGGKKTRYAHASKLFVKVGDTVNKGEHIAAMGSTGWSTGPHVHFEVMINGKKYNPLNYTK